MRGRSRNSCSSGSQSLSCGSARLASARHLDAASNTPSPLRHSGNPSMSVHAGACSKTRQPPSRTARTLLRIDSTSSRRSRDGREPLIDRRVSTRRAVVRFGRVVSRLAFRTAGEEEGRSAHECDQSEVLAGSYRCASRCRCLQTWATRRDRVRGGRDLLIEPRAPANGPLQSRTPRQRRLLIHSR